MSADKSSPYAEPGERQTHAEPGEKANPPSLVHGRSSLDSICWICRSRPSSVCHLGPRFSEGLGPSGSDAKLVRLVDYKPKQARWLDVTLVRGG